MTEVERLIKALQDILADHDERCALFGDMENQPNRKKVMEYCRRLLREIDVMATGACAWHRVEGLKGIDTFVWWTACGRVYNAMARLEPGSKACGCGNKIEVVE